MFDERLKSELFIEVLWATKFNSFLRNNEIRKIAKAILGAFGLTYSFRLLIRNMALVI